MKTGDRIILIEDGARGTVDRVETSWARFGEVKISVVWDRKDYGYYPEWFYTDELRYLTPLEQLAEVAE